MNSNYNQFQPEYPETESHNERIAAVVVILLIVALLIYFAIVLLSGSGPRENVSLIKPPDGHVDVIDSDPMTIANGIMASRCFKVDVPSGYVASSKIGCGAVLNLKDGGGLLTAVYISYILGEKSLDQAQDEFVKHIEETGKNNPKVGVVSKTSTPINGGDARTIDYTDPYGLKYRYYIIAAPEGKYSYNSQSISAFTIAGYLSQELPVGAETPVETVVKNFTYIKN